MSYNLSSKLKAKSSFYCNPTHTNESAFISVLYLEQNELDLEPNVTVRETATRMEARGRRGKMGGKGRRCIGEKVKEEKGCIRGTRKGT